MGGPDPFITISAGGAPGGMAGMELNVAMASHGQAVNAAWDMTVDNLGRFGERLQSRGESGGLIVGSAQSRS